ncbi:MAG: transposase [Pirellulales bacterium]|nr:transposase [Pirellulales bacterium]
MSSSAYRITFGVMQLDGPRRKQVKHFDTRADVRELTFSCFDRQPLLTNDAWRTLLSQSVDRALARHCYHLAAFVYMPEHVHLIVWPEANAAPMQAVLRAIKRPVSYRIKQQLIERQSPLLRKLIIQQRPGVSVFRFWQEGPGYDRNLSSGDAVLQAIDYVHQNPTRRRLSGRAEDWLWSSARWFLDPEAAADPRLPKLQRLPPHFFD